MTPLETLRAAARLMRERMDAPVYPSSDRRFVLAVAEWLDDQADDECSAYGPALAVARAYLEEA